MTALGTLNERLTIQRATVTRNEFNEPVETWNTVAVVWTSRSDVKSSESFRALEVGSELTTRFVIKFFSLTADINPADRVIYKGRLYNIVGIRTLVRNRWLELNCVARDDIAAADA